MRKSHNPSVTGTRTLGKPHHTLKSARALTLKQVDILNRQGREVLQEPRTALLHFKPLTLPLPQNENGHRCKYQAR